MKILGPFVSHFLYLIFVLTKNEGLRSIILKFNPDHNKGRLIGLSRESRLQCLKLQKASQLIAEAGRLGLEVDSDLVFQSKSQILQDCVCVLAFAQKRDGYFVEVGVGDGVTLSNSYLLEKRFNWSGLLCEPAQIFGTLIDEARSAKLIRNAVTDQDGQVLRFQEDAEIGEHSRLVKTDSSKPSGKTVTYAVQTKTLAKIFEENQSPRFIEFLSIDTEGFELEALKGIDFRVVEFGLICVEHNYDKAKANKIFELLKMHGYVRFWESVSEFDHWYINPKVVSVDLSGTYV